jgi:hypothetical protein
MTWYVTFKSYYLFHSFLLFFALSNDCFTLSSFSRTAERSIWWNHFINAVINHQLCCIYSPVDCLATRSMTTIPTHKKTHNGKKISSILHVSTRFDLRMYPLFTQQSKDDRYKYKYTFFLSNQTTRFVWKKLFGLNKTIFFNEICFHETNRSKFV